jgi:hypothetical protein
MADLAYRNDILEYRRGGRADWGAIWAGMFAFIAIWSVFGALGVAIFTSNANPNAAHPIFGQSVGEGFWSAILTLIAMYVGGRVTGHLAKCMGRRDATVHGLAMFGLGVAAMVVMLLGGAAATPATVAGGGAHNPYVLTFIADVGWVGFVSLFLGWIGAIIGTNAGVKAQAARDLREIRPAA